jgi:GT2 family glycosyltransferase
MTIVENDLAATIIIPCYTADRWDTLVDAIVSASNQTYASRVVVVVDHNPTLAARLRRRFRTEAPGEAGDEVTVLENRFARGVSGARNTGAFAAGTDLLAFLDDDATADPAWLKQLVEGYVSSPGAVGAGGAILPVWEDSEPTWLPEEFLWTVSATPPDRAHGRVRNVWGANMLVERSAFMDVGGFSTTFGKLGDVPEPEDTELCMRMSARQDVALGWIFAPEAIVWHAVPTQRCTWSYFLQRCWSEGAGKAALAAHGARETTDLGEETDFVRSVLSRGLGRSFRKTLGGDRTAPGQACAMFLGTAWAGAGFVMTILRRRRSARRQGIPATTTVDGSVGRVPAPRLPLFGARRSDLTVRVASLTRGEAA